MFKCLFATCLTALSVNTQGLPVSRSLEPSMAITQDTTFNVGDRVSLDFTFSFNETDFFIDLIDTDYAPLKLIDFSYGASTPYFLRVTNETDTINLAVFTIFNTYTYGNMPTIFYSENYDTGDVFSIDIYLSEPRIIEVDIQFNFIFEILEGFDGFNSEAYPYLTKLEQPYTPPSKSNLYRLLYDFYYSIFNDDDLTAISTGYNMPFDNWLAHTCTIATLITLIVVAFFFLRWLFKVISGLTLLKR